MARRDMISTSMLYAQSTAKNATNVFARTETSNTSKLKATSGTTLMIHMLRLDSRASR